MTSDSIEIPSGQKVRTLKGEIIRLKYVEEVIMLDKKK
jgi:hypothetical protein